MRRASDRRLSARVAHFDAETKSGTASKRIGPFDGLTSRDEVFLILRVSNRERRANLKDQDANLRDVVSEVGAKIVGQVQKAISGFDPSWLKQVAMEAKAAGATVLLAETADRFIRHRDFHSNDRPDLQATDEQLQELVECTGGMRLMTHLDPDATPFQVRSYQRKRGQKQKRRKGGRPKNRTAGFMVRRFEEKIGLVRWLHARGWKIRDIAAKPMVGVAKSTVADWLKR